MGARYLKNSPLQPFNPTPPKSTDSFIWKIVLKGWAHHAKWAIGDGLSARFWHDPWLNYVAYPFSTILYGSLSQNDYSLLVSNFINQKRWDLSAIQYPIPRRNQVTDFRHFYHPECFIRERYLVLASYSQCQIIYLLLLSYTY